MKFFDPTNTQKKAWAEWLAERPKCVRVVAMRFPPWQIFELEGSKNVVQVRSFEEDKKGEVTMTVSVEREHNPDIWLERSVFGVREGSLRPVVRPTE